MSQMNVTQFASELKMPANVLLEQLQKAGVSKQAAHDTLTEQDKANCLNTCASRMATPMARPRSR